jgi:hypothetical protein
MSIKSQFTPAEWEQLQLTLAEVTYAVKAAQPGGELQENFALFGSQEDVLDQFGNSQLVPLLFVQSDSEAAMLKERVEDRGKRAAKAAQIDATYLCRTSIALLRQKNLPEQDIEAFRGVIVALASKVARAAKEGGFLGIGGERVTDVESKVIQEIEKALT